MLGLWTKDDSFWSMLHLLVLGLELKALSVPFVQSSSGMSELLLGMLRAAGQP
jgi:hypothetical protein